VDPLQLAFSAVPDVAYASTSSGLVNPKAKPGNVHILTLEWLSCDTVLLRLSHMFMTGEHAKYAEVAEVKLGDLIDVKIQSIVESTLFGERPLTEADKQVERWPSRRQHHQVEAAASSHGHDGPRSLILEQQNHWGGGWQHCYHAESMQIRTFTITVQRKHSSCVDPEPEAKDEEGGGREGGICGCGCRGRGWSARQIG